MRRWASAFASAAALAAGLIVWLAAPQPAGAAKLTSDSPEVKRAIQRAVKFLASDAADYSALGGKALIGLALLKAGVDPKHPKIQGAAEAIQKGVRALDPKTQGLDIYSSGLSIIFLITLDSSKYGPEIELVMTYLQSVQKPHGGWGYTERETGDTSMTQYAVLSAWEATQAGFRVPRPMMEKVCDWLIRTQDPGGGFAYQGTVAEGAGQVKQAGVRVGMTTAAMGALYICSNVLGIAEKLVEREDDLPRALKAVKAKEARILIDGAMGIEPRRVRSAMSQGNGWMRANYDPEPPKTGFIHYYLYALERYWSFREAAEGEKDEKWYADGARYLVDTQGDDGTWASRQEMTVPDTAFGTLFLLRSSKKSIQRAYAFGAGLLVGGRGLPRDVARVELVGGKVIPRPTPDAAQRLLVLLNDPDNPDYPHAIYALGNLAAEDARALAITSGDKLRALAEGAPRPVRVVALRLLAQTRNLDYVPLFVYALGDADPAVMHEGYQGLLFLSRKSSGESVPSNPSPATRQALVDKWKAWYLSIRPDAEFLN